MTDASSVQIATLENFEPAMTTPHQITPALKGRVTALASALAMLLCGVVLSVQALTLGELQGKAVIGQALSVGIRVQASPDEVLAAMCVSADVYYADALQKAPRITIKPGVVHITLSELVNEPVVTVLMRTQCGSHQTRRYVVLADLPTTTVVSTEPDFSSAASSPPLVVLPQRTGTDKPIDRTSARSETAASATKAANTVIVKKTRSSATPLPRNRQTANNSAGRSVLKLDPMEILSDRMDSLDTSMLFAPTEDALLQSKQIAALQADLKSMRELALKSDNTLLQLRSELQQAQAQQFPQALVYGLIGLVLICLSGLAWLWHKQKKVAPAADSWWQDPAYDEADPLTNPEESPRPPSLEAASAFATPPPEARTAGTLQTPAWLKPADQPDDHMKPETPSASAILKNQANPDVGITPHQLNPESVQDIRQQADFFISLGQSHRAIQILVQQMTTSDIPNPLMCMDLLGLYHSLGQTSEFDKMRDACQQHFNVHIPDVTTFQQEGRGLEAYPDVLDTLTRLWPGVHALAFMDTCIFLNTKTKFLDTFDLAAFRELLTLHAVAEELALDMPINAPKKTRSRPELFAQPTQISEFDPPMPPLIDLNLDSRFLTSADLLPAAPAKPEAAGLLMPAELALFDRPLNELDIFPDFNLPTNQPEVRATDAAPSNLIDLDFDLPEAPGTGTTKDSSGTQSTP